MTALQSLATLTASSPSPLVLSSGYPALDAWLPDGGWSAGILTELLLDSVGIGELSLLLPAIIQKTQASTWVHCINSPYSLYAPAWQAAGVVLERLLELRPTVIKDQLWVIEQSIQLPTCQAVIAWVEQVEDRWLRRLQLCAAQHQCFVVLLRSKRWMPERSAAALRLALAAEREGLRVRVVKARARMPGQSICLPWDKDIATLSVLAR
jgi:hypothetical protein